MALRHLVTGQNNCAPDGASSSNPLNALANAFLGQSSKAQVSLRTPTAAGTVSSVAS
jgi:peroxin-5